MPEIALVTLIRGVCREGVTFQMTIYPMKIAITKIIKRFMNSLPLESEPIAYEIPTKSKMSKEEMTKKLNQIEKNIQI